MIEGELFGYVKGAFTGAVADFPGHDRARPAAARSFSMRSPRCRRSCRRASSACCRSASFVRSAAPRRSPANFRLVAATNRADRRSRAQRALRQDLYYRLNTFQIEIPPLRERREDIPALVSTFVQRFAAQLGKPEPHDHARGVRFAAQLRVAGQYPRAAERHRIQRRPGGPRTDHAEATAHGSAAPAGAAGRAHGRRRAADAQSRGTGKDTPSCKRSPRRTATRRKPRRSSASIAPRFTAR